MTLSQPGLYFSSHSYSTTATSILGTYLTFFNPKTEKWTLSKKALPNYNAQNDFVDTRYRLIGSNDRDTLYAIPIDAGEADWLLGVHINPNDPLSYTLTNHTITATTSGQIPSSFGLTPDNIAFDQRRQLLYLRVSSFCFVDCQALMSQPRYLRDQGTGGNLESTGTMWAIDMNGGRQVQAASNKVFPIFVSSGW